MNSFRRFKHRLVRTLRTLLKRIQSINWWFDKVKWGKYKAISLGSYFPSCLSSLPSANRPSKRPHISIKQVDVVEKQSSNGHRTGTQSIGHRFVIAAQLIMPTVCGEDTCLIRWPMPLAFVRPPRLYVIDLCCSGMPYSHYTEEAFRGLI